MKGCILCPGNCFPLSFISTVPWLARRKLAIHVLCTLLFGNKTHPSAMLREFQRDSSSSTMMFLTLGLFVSYFLFPFGGSVITGCQAKFGHFSPFPLFFFFSICSLFWLNLSLFFVLQVWLHHCLLKLHVVFLLCLSCLKESWFISLLWKGRKKDILTANTPFFGKIWLRSLFLLHFRLFRV